MTPGSDIALVLRGPFGVLAFGRLLDSIGGGLTLSLLVVYLSQVRGLSILTASLVLAWMAAVALAATPAVGTLTDRLGPRRVVLCAVALEAVGVALMAFVTSAGAAFAVAGLMALGASGVWGPMTTFTAQIVDERLRPTAFALGFMLLNLGLGLGGLIGAVIVNLDQPSSFQVLYLVDAMTYVALWCTVASMRRHGGPSAPIAGPESTAGWREVIRDRRLIGLASVSLVLVVFGYGSLEAGLAVYITAVAGESEKLIGIVWFANTATIVVVQLFVLRWVGGRSRVRMIGIAALLWATAWALVIPAPLVSKAMGVVLFVVFAIIFAIGESVWSPTIPSLVNAIAPDHLRGRYNSAQSVTWSMGSVLAPVATGLLIGAGLGVLWASFLTVGCVIGGLAAQRLRRVLTPAEDGRD